MIGHEARHVQGFLLGTGPGQFWSQVRKLVLFYYKECYTIFRGSFLHLIKSLREITCYGLSPSHDLKVGSFSQAAVRLKGRTPNPGFRRRYSRVTS